jgi:hypothetical protein
MSNRSVVKGIRTLLALVALSAVGMTSNRGGATPGVSQQSGLRISGTVKVNGIPSVGVSVSLSTVVPGQPLPEIDATRTGTEGEYTFPTSPAGQGLPPGDYLVRVSETPVDSWNPERVVELASQSRSINFGYDTVWVLVDTLTHRDFPRLRVDKDPLYIVPGHTIQWVVGEVTEDSETGDEVLSRLSFPLTVHFPSLSPLLFRRQMAEPAEDLGSILGQVRAEILPGKYTYFVAVFHRGLEKILTEDPEIIDENGDDPGGGNRGT